MTDLPTYAEARSECLENDNPSCLAWFITEHEGGRPGSLEEQTFRADLAAAIEEAKCQGFQEAETQYDAWKHNQLAMWSHNGVVILVILVIGAVGGLMIVSSLVSIISKVFGVGS